MKKKQKILIIIVTVIFLVSVVTVNAAAFDHDLSIEEIPGYTTDHLDAIYGDDYVILRLGTFTELGYGYDPDYISMWDGCSLERLNQFIYDAEEQFYSPAHNSGVYYEGIHVGYIELCMLDADEYGYSIEGPLWNGSDQFVFKRGYDNVVIGNSIFLWENPDNEYDYYFNVSSELLSQIGLNDLCDSVLYAICYFNGATPYDYTGANLASKVEELQTQNTELQTQKTELVEECKELQRVSHEHFVRANTLEYKLREMENANALDEIFTGTAQSILIFIRGVADLGYSPAPGINITLGGLLTVSVIAAFVVFLLRMIFGGSKGD